MVDNSEKILWSVKEAAEYSGISEAKIRGYAKKEDCPFSIRVGRCIRIKRREFEEYLSNIKEF